MHIPYLAHYGGSEATTVSKQPRRSKLSLQVKLVTPIYYMTKFQGIFISQKMTWLPGDKRDPLTCLASPQVKRERMHFFIVECNLPYAWPRPWNGLVGMLMEDCLSPREKPSIGPDRSTRVRSWWTLPTTTGYRLVCFVSFFAFHAWHFTDLSMLSMLTCFQNFQMTNLHFTTDLGLDSVSARFRASVQARVHFLRRAPV